MLKLSFKIALPVILTGLFAIIVFIAAEYEKIESGIYIVFLFLSIYIFLFGFAMGQNFASPIRKILKRATELSEGDLKTRIYLETKDELGELSRIFNKIAQNLEESHMAGEKAEETIDIKVKARTQALEETISALEQKISNRTYEIERATAEIEKLKTQIQKKEEEISLLKQEKSRKTAPKKDKTTEQPAKEEPDVDIK